VLSPLFFVLMGAKVDPSVLFRPATLGFASLLALLGVMGKLVAGYGSGRKIRAAVVGWGMVPRGEVGLIFVATGAHLQLNGAPLMNPEVQAGVIGALLLTTIVGPVGLAWVLRARVRRGFSP
jgi:Kef-type K+ transport system membrane component KefB